MTVSSLGKVMWRKFCGVCVSVIGEKRASKDSVGKGEGRRGSWRG